MYLFENSSNPNCFYFNIQNGGNSTSEKQNPDVNQNQKMTNFQGFNLKNVLPYSNNVDGYIHNVQDGYLTGGNGTRMDYSNFGNSFFAAPGGPISSQPNHTNESSVIWNKNMPKKVFILFIFMKSYY